MKLTSDNIKAGLLLAGALGAVYVVYKAKKEVTEIVTVKINPASSGNLIYSSLPNDGFIKSGGLDPVFKFLGL